MTEAALLSPARMALTLLGWAAGAGLGAAILGVAMSPACLALDVAQLRGAAALLGAALLAGLSGTTLGLVALMRRSTPVYRGLSRARLDPQAPPPSSAALRDTFALPRRLIVLASVPAVAVIALDLLGVLPLSGLAGGRRLALDVYALALALLTATPVELLWHRSLWSWLGRVTPSDIPRPVVGSVADRTRLRIALPTASVGLGALAVELAHVGVRLPVIVEVVSVTLAVAVAAYVGRRLGQVTAHDIRELSLRISNLTDPGDRQGQETAGALVRPCRTVVASELAEQVSALAARHEEAAAEEARSRRAVEEAQRLKSRFMAYMSHDLRSPLNSIQGFAEILAGEVDGPLDPAQLESVEMIRDSGETLLRLVTDILDSARLEAGRLVLHRTWTPSVEIITDAVAKVMAGARERRVEIYTQLAAGLPPLRVDSVRVVQALSGVLGHVVRAMDGGTVRVRARVTDGPPGPDRQLRVDVIDASGALRAEDRERMFEAFREMREPSGRRIGGLGLGLSLARALVMEHGGDVWVGSADQQDTTFCIALPLEEEPITA